MAFGVAGAVSAGIQGLKAFSDVIEHSKTASTGAHAAHHAHKARPAAASGQAAPQESFAQIFSQAKSALGLS